MATLADVIRQRQRTLTLRVRVAGILLNAANPRDKLGVPAVHRVVTAKSIDSPAPTCTITLSRMPIWMKAGQAVTVEAGYNGLTQRIFTGTIQRRVKDIDHGELVCVGTLHKLVRATMPAMRDLNGFDVRTAIANLFVAAGITNYKVDEVPNTFIIGTASDSQLAATSWLQMLKYLMELEGCLLYETGDGIPYVRPMSPLPATTAFKTFRTDDAANAYILAVPFDEDPTQLRTRFTLTGAVVAGAALSQTATLSNSDLIQPPGPAGFFIGSDHYNPLADTTDRLTKMLELIAFIEGRVPGRARMLIPGDPQLEPAQTLYIKAPEIDFDGNAFIYGVSHAIDAQAGWATALDVRGGDTTGGTLGLNPVASFNFSVEREVLGTQVYAFVTLDASRSFDPDGTIADPAGYVWTTNQAAAVTDIGGGVTLNGATGRRITARVDPATAVGDFIVTLTVTDNSGLATSVSQTIPIAADGEGVIVPPHFVANSNRFSASPDGGQTWNDQSTAATNVSTVAAMPPAGVFVGIACYGRDDGAIYRTTDFDVGTLTLVRAASGVGIKDLAWDWREITKAWALQDDFKLLRSIDLGATWAQRVDFIAALGIPATSKGRHIGLPAAGGVWCYGGNGVVGNGRPLIVLLDPSGNPTSIQASYGGELAADLGSGPTNLRIVDAVDMGDGGGFIMILENYNASDSGVRGLYWTPSPPNTGAGAAGWKRIGSVQGLPAALTAAGIYVVPTETPGIFVAAFSDRNTYLIDTTSGTPVATQRANVMPVNVLPRKAIWMRDESQGLTGSGPMTYLIAAKNSASNWGEVYKSHDKIATVGLVRPATGFPASPAASDSLDIAIASRGPTATDDKIVAMQSPVGASPQIYERDCAALIGGVWVKKEDGGSASQDPAWNLKKLGANHYRLLSQGGNLNNDYRSVVGQLQRSIDGCLSWSNVGPAPQTVGGFLWGVSDYCIAPDGTLWLCATSEVGNAQIGLEPVVHKSTNDGATWGSFVYKETTQSSASWERMHRIDCNPNDYRKVRVLGDTSIGICRTWSTDNAGVSFTRKTGGANQSVSADRAFVCWDNDRLGQFQGDNFFKSDDQGGNWGTGVDVIGGGQFVYAFTRGLPTGHAFVSGGSVLSPELWRTKDYGVSWQQLLSAADLPSTIDQITSIAYDAAHDILYMAANTNEPAGALDLRIYALDNASTLAPSAGTQTVRHATLNLDALFNERVAHMGLALR